MDSALYRAAKTANIEVLKTYKERLLKQETFPAKHTVLHVVAQHSDSAIAIQEILSVLDSSSQESLLTRKNIAGETALYIAARNRRKHIVEQLIKSAKALPALPSPDLEGGDGVVSLESRMARLANDNGDTPLHEAVNNKDEVIVRLLVDADPKYQHLPNNMGKTPLYIAFEKRHNDDCPSKRLLSYFSNSVNLISSSDPTLKAILTVCKYPGIDGPRGETILHAATRRKETSEWISEICKRFSDITTIHDINGFNPLHNAARYNNLEGVKALLAADKSMAYISVANKDKHESMTPLHIAASRGYTEVIEEILKRCEDCFDAITSKGQNILHLAAKGQHTASIRFIVNKPWAINLLNMKDDDGNTPAHLLLSSMPKHYKKIKPLLDVTTVYVDVLNKQHSTPLELFNKAEKQFTSKKISILDKLQNKFGRVEKIPWMIDDDDMNGTAIKEIEKTEGLEEMRKTAETQLIVAALIATVTFAAGFTLPGGYHDDGPDKGTAVLIKRAAFKAFVVTDTISVMSSFAAIFLHFTATLYKRDVEKISKRYKIALSFLLIAMISMAITFVTGLYVVLEKSPAMAITVCIIGCLGVLFLLHPIRKVYREMGFKFVFGQYFFACIVLAVPFMYYNGLVFCFVTSFACLKYIYKNVGGISKKVGSRSVTKVHSF